VQLRKEISLLADLLENSNEYTTRLDNISSKKHIGFIKLHKNEENITKNENFLYESKEIKLNNKTYILTIGKISHI
jgi:hypothetical protein